MSAMRVLRFASAARAGSVSRPSSLWRPTKCAWMFGRRPGAPCSETANTSVPWKESLQDTTRCLYAPEHLLQRWEEGILESTARSFVVLYRTTHPDNAVQERSSWATKE